MCRYDETHLPPNPAAPSLARRWIDDRLGTWELTSAADDLRLVVSELVTNAVLHARTSVQVQLAIAEGVLELVIRDGNPRSPRPRVVRPDNAATGGRGLLLVEELSDAWGVADRSDGKEVWFRVAAPEGWRYAGACICAEPTQEDATRTASGRRVVRIQPGAFPTAT
jgi:anti-sigma regulatory factor (Ser/Thr protein kinase)